MSKYLRVLLCEKGLLCEVASFKEARDIGDPLLLSADSLRSLSILWPPDSPLDFLTFLKIVFPDGSVFVINEDLNLNEIIDDLAYYLCHDQIDVLTNFVQDVLDWNGFRNFCKRRASSNTPQTLKDILPHSPNRLQFTDSTLTLTNSSNLTDSFFLSLLDNKDEEIKQMQKRWDDEKSHLETTILDTKLKLESVVETLSSTTNSLERPETSRTDDSTSFPEFVKRNLTRADTPIPTRPRKTPRGILKQFREEQGENSTSNNPNQQGKRRGFSKQVQWVHGTVFYDRKPDIHVEQPTIRRQSRDISSFIIPKFPKMRLKRENSVADSEFEHDTTSRYFVENVVENEEIKSRRVPTYAISTDSDSEDTWEEDEVEWETPPQPQAATFNNNRRRSDCKLKQAAQDVLEVRKSYQEKTREKSNLPFSVTKHLLVPPPQFQHAARLRDRMSDLEVIEEIDEILDEDDEYDSEIPTPTPQDAVINIVQNLANLNENSVPLTSIKSRRSSLVDEAVQTTPTLPAQQIYMLNRARGSPSPSRGSPSRSLRITNDGSPTLRFDDRRGYQSVDSNQDTIYSHSPIITAKRSSDSTSKSTMSIDEVQESVRADMQAALNAKRPNSWKDRFTHLSGVSSLKRSMSDVGKTAKLIKIKGAKRVEEFAQSGKSRIDINTNLERGNSLKRNWSFRLSGLFERRSVGERPAIGYVLSSEEDVERDGRTSSRDISQPENELAGQIKAFIG